MPGEKLIWPQILDSLALSMSISAGLLWCISWYIGGVFKYAKITASVEKSEIQSVKSWLVPLIYLSMWMSHLFTVLPVYFFCQIGLFFLLTANFPIWKSGHLLHSLWLFQFQHLYKLTWEDMNHACYFINFLMIANCVSLCM